jgi:hypothetical protein
MTKTLITLIYFLILPASYAVDDSFYAQAGVIVWTRNFEEASPRGNNDGVEKTEGGFSFAVGKELNKNWAVELEFLSTMEFSVVNASRSGLISMNAFTLAPKYSFAHDWLLKDLSFFAKLRLGWTKIKGADIYDNFGNEEALTLGPAIGVDYRINENFASYLDIGGLWVSGDVEDYDFHPWQLGIRYLFN